MKRWSITKLDKKNNVEITSNKFDDDVISENYNVIDIFSIYGQFGAIWKSDSGHIVYKTFIFVTSNFLSYKNWKQN